MQLNKFPLTFLKLTKAQKLLTLAKELAEFMLIQLELLVIDLAKLMDFMEQLVIGPAPPSLHPLFV